MTEMEDTDAAPTVPAAVLQLADQQFRQWRHHPVSEVVLQYLKDYQQALLRELQQRWLQGSVRYADEAEARGRVLVVVELRELQLDAIRAFYGLPQEEEEDDDEDAEDKEEEEDESEDEDDDDDLMY